MAILRSVWQISRCCLIVFKTFVGRVRWYQTRVEETLYEALLFVHSSFVLVSFVRVVPMRSMSSPRRCLSSAGRV